MLLRDSVQRLYVSNNVQWRLLVLLYKINRHAWYDECTNERRE